MHRITVRIALTFLSFLVLVVAPSPSVHAQAGQICLFADQEGTTCNLSDSGPGLLQVHVLHMGATSVSSVSFAAPKPACMAGATWLADNPGPNLLIGNSQTGAAVAYGVCVGSPYQVMTITYVVTGGSVPGCAYPVTPYPGKPYVEVVECPNQLRYGMSGTTYVNAETACSCTELQSPAILDVEPTNLLYLAGDVEKTVDVRNLGDQPMTWDVQWSEPWLSVSPSSGTNDQTLTFTVDRTGLDLGYYDDRVDIVSSAGTATILVNMRNLSDQPTLSVSLTTLDFAGSGVQSSFAIKNLGIQSLEWTVSENAPWLAVSRTSGTDDANVSVTVDRTGLAGGAYADTIYVSSNGGDATVAVSMIVPWPPALDVSPASLDFGITSVLDTLTITNTGGPGLDWTIDASAPWLSASPSTGMDDRQVDILVDRAGLANGVHTDSLHVTSNGGDAAVPVTLTQQPVLRVSPASLDFPGTTTRTFSLLNDGSGTLTWSIAASEPWAQVDQTSGTGEAVITATIDTSGLADGAYTATLSVTSNGGDADVALDVQVGPELSVMPTELAFTAADTVKRFGISNVSTGTLSWTVTPSKPWLHVSPAAGTGYAVVFASVDADSLGYGTFGAVAAVASDGGDQDVAVTFSRQVPPTQNGGVLFIYGDAAYTRCDLDDSAPSLQTLYIRHENYPCVTACRFRLESHGYTGSWFVDVTVGNFVDGSTLTGAYVQYGAGVATPYPVVNATYLGLGTSPPCSYIDVVADPRAATGVIEAIDCESRVLKATSTRLTINSDGSCACGIRTEPSSWSKIKGMYRPKPKPAPDGGK